MYKKAAGLVAEMGYTNVMTFKGGIPAWVAAGNSLDASENLGSENISTLSAEELKAELGSVRVVDIRPAALYKMGWIPGSIKIPLGKLSADYASIDTGKSIVLVDHAGKQVLAAGRYLKSKGYSDVKRLQGGLMAWIVKGYAMER